MNKNKAVEELGFVVDKEDNNITKGENKIKKVYGEKYIDKVNEQLSSPSYFKHKIK